MIFLLSQHPKESTRYMQPQKSFCIIEWVTQENGVELCSNVSRKSQKQKHREVLQNFRVKEWRKRWFFLFIISSANRTTQRYGRIKHSFFKSTVGGNGLVSQFPFLGYFSFHIPVAKYVSKILFLSPVSAKREFLESVLQDWEVISKHLLPSRLKPYWGLKSCYWH